MKKWYVTWRLKGAGHAHIRVSSFSGSGVDSDFRGMVSFCVGFGRFMGLGALIFVISETNH